MDNNRQQQLDLQKLVQAKGERKAQLFEERLNSELFPMDRLSESWKWKATIAIHKATPLSQRISLEQFAGVVAANVHENITLFQFGILSNCMEAVSVDDLSICSPSEYAELMKEAVEHIKWYGARVEAMRKEIDKEVDE